VRAASACGTDVGETNDGRRGKSARQTLGITGIRNAYAECRYYGRCSRPCAEWGARLLVRKPVLARGTGRMLDTEI